MVALPKIFFKKSLLSINENTYKFKGYNFLELVPSGSNAIILKAEQPVLKRIVIVKVWYKLKEQDLRDKKKQGIEEAVKLSKLEHPNICKIFFVGTNRNLFYAVLEYIEGKSLNLFLQDNTALNIRYNLWGQIASALSYSYQQGYYHGDLHDKNILICPDKSVKLLDFGTSYFAGKATSESREKRMLFELTQRMFPEHDIKHYIEINLLKLSPFHVLRGLFYWVDIISANFFAGNNRANEVFGILTCIAQAPIFNVALLEDIGEFKKNRGTYIGMFSSHVELARNREAKYGKSNIFDFELMKKVYLEWRKEYLLMDIMTLGLL